MISLLKDLVSKVPYPIGKILTKIPFNYRLGNLYTVLKNEIEESEKWSEDQRLTYIISQLSNIKETAQGKFSFYSKIYAEYGVTDLLIKDLSDWQKLPVIEKEMLRGALKSFSGSQKINTGGTTGEPFAFFVDRQAWVREWAHMHYIWEKKGYNYLMPKITLRGRNLGRNIYRFNPVHNEFIFNTYIDFSKRKYALKFKDLVLSKKIQFVHGYPSAIYNFFIEIEQGLDKGEIEEIKKTIRVCLLGSEFPLEYMTSYLREKWELDYISWYGHSEMCVLAYDIDRNNTYVPFLTYGYAEVSNHELIGTSYHNTDMPLIRYRTGDLVDATMREDLLHSFTVTKGRSGDFIEDRHGKKIPLTGLIFGRHHIAFEFYDFVQIEQTRAGEATILVTNKSGKSFGRIDEYFDLGNVDIDFSFKELKAPILSNSGKFKLKI